MTLFFVVAPFVTFAARHGAAYVGKWYPKRVRAEREANDHAIRTTA